VDGDREPDEAEEKIEHQDEEREAEHGLVPPRREIIDRDRHEQHEFGDGPDERTPFDVIVPDAAGKVDFPYGKLRHDVIRRCLLPIRQKTFFRAAENECDPSATVIYLAVSSGERHPSRGRPPSDEKAKEPSVLGPCAFGRPYVDGTTQGQRRADFGEDEGGDEHENHGYKVG